MSKYLLLPILLAVGSLSGCAGLDDPYYDRPYGGGYNDPYYNGGYGGYEDERRERRELERERDRLEWERRRLEEERRREQYSPPPPPPPARAPERCPSGFSPSERKCSQEERRRGCKDMRLPGGLGCVKR